jgi:hypothetical protein
MQAQYFVLTDVWVSIYWASVTFSDSEALENSTLERKLEKFRIELLLRLLDSLFSHGVLCSPQAKSGSEGGWVREHLKNSACAVIQIMLPWMSVGGTETGFLHCSSWTNESVSQQRRPDVSHG